MCVLRFFTGCAPSDIFMYCVRASRFHCILLQSHFVAHFTMPPILQSWIISFIRCSMKMAFQKKSFPVLSPYLMFCDICLQVPITDALNDFFPAFFPFVPKEIEKGCHVNSISYIILPREFSVHLFLFCFFLVLDDIFLSNAMLLFFIISFPLKELLLFPSSLASSCSLCYNGLDFVCEWSSYFSQEKRWQKLFLVFPYRVPKSFSLCQDAYNSIEVFPIFLTLVTRIHKTI